MSAAVREAAEQIERRLEELSPLVAEYKTLESVRREMKKLSVGSKPRVAKPVVTTGSKNGHGETAEAVKKLVTKSPEGISVAQIAEKLGKHPSYIYAVVARLVDRGVLFRDDHLVKAHETRTRIVKVA